MKSICLSNRQKNISLIALLTGVSASLLVAVFAPRQSAISKLTSHRLSASSTARALTSEQARAAYGRIEMSFEANRGQTDASVNFLARGSGYTLFLKPTEAVFQLRNANRQTAISKQQSASEEQVTEESAISNRESQTQHSALSTQHSKVLRMKLVGADAERVGRRARTSWRARSTISSATTLRRGAPTFRPSGACATRKSIRASTSSTTATSGSSSTTSSSRPDATPRAVRLEFDGADKVEVDAAGELLLTLGESVVRQPKPFVYQEVAGARREVEGGYALERGRARRLRARRVRRAACRSSSTRCSSTPPTSAAAATTRPATSRWTPPATPTFAARPPRPISPRPTPSTPRSTPATSPQTATPSSPSSTRRARRSSTPPTSAAAATP